MASLAGLSIGAGETALPFELYLQALQSRQVADELSKRDDIMTTLFAGDWDQESKQWQAPADWDRSINRRGRRMLGLPLLAWQPPNGARLQEYLVGSIRIVRLSTVPVVSVTYDHTRPEFAVGLLRALHEAADSMVRKRALERSTLYIQYLSNQLATVNVAEHRLAITQSLSEQEQFRMMASANTPYAAEPFDGPVSSLGPTSPRALVVMALSAAISMLLGTVLALVLGDRDFRFWNRSARGAIRRDFQLPRET